MLTMGEVRRRQLIADTRAQICIKLKMFNNVINDEHYNY